MKVLVYGLGRSGTAAATLLRRQGHTVLAYDAALRDSESRLLDSLGITRTDTPQDADVDLCVAAPGVPYDHPDLAALRGRGTETIGEVEWVSRSVAADILGVTGTAGKTTVSHWLYETLRGAGRDTRLGGNVDPALSAVAEPGAALVTELSSFQLERCPTLRPKVAVVLNLGRDHIDRHGSVAAYHAAKRNIIANLGAGDTFVYNRDDPALRDWAAALTGSEVKTFGFSLEEQADAYALGDDPVLTLRSEPLVRASDLQMTGRPARANALAVALAAHAYGVDVAAIRAALVAFQGVEGRYALVREVGGVRFIDDSIATRMLAVAAALESTPAPVVWIAGGEDKGAEFAPLAELIRERVTLFVGIGRAGPAFARQVAGWTDTYVCDEEDGEAALARACRVGLEHLRQHHPHEAGSVLLAPLAASFDQFRDYRERATLFRQVAARLAEEASWIRS
ncbi:MAG: UDP-N-acetylmuramoyl-L-alanine--D-glutamate ligase [Trueperaceae bacterium]|nr:UDP-N-acetylmuramoyl-L-alanine--D-glutamate ligase [Trueperaceae bacterium]